MSPKHNATRALAAGLAAAARRGALSARRRPAVPRRRGAAAAQAQQRIDALTGGVRAPDRLAPDAPRRGDTDAPPRPRHADGPTVVEVTPAQGFDWTSAAIGAGAGIALALIAIAGRRPSAAGRRPRRTDPAIRSNPIQGAPPCHTASTSLLLVCAALAIAAPVAAADPGSDVPHAATFPLTCPDRTVDGHREDRRHRAGLPRRRLRSRTSASRGSSAASSSSTSPASTTTRSPRRRARSKGSCRPPAGRSPPPGSGPARTRTDRLRPRNVRTADRRETRALLPASIHAAGRRRRARGGGAGARNPQRPGGRLPESLRDAGREAPCKARPAGERYGQLAELALLRQPRRGPHDPPEQRPQAVAAEPADRRVPALPRRRQRS